MLLELNALLKTSLIWLVHAMLDGRTLVGGSFLLIVPKNYEFVNICRFLFAVLGRS